MSIQQDCHKTQTSYILKVNIHCGACEQKVKKLMHKIDGVYSVSIDREHGKVVVAGNVDPTRLIKTLKRSGKNAEMWDGHKGIMGYDQNYPNNNLHSQNLQVHNGNGVKYNNDSQNQNGPQLAHFQNSNRPQDFKVPTEPHKSVNFNIPVMIFDDMQNFDEGIGHDHLMHNNTMMNTMMPPMENVHGPGGLPGIFNGPHGQPDMFNGPNSQTDMFNGPYAAASTFNGSYAPMSAFNGYNAPPGMFNGPNAQGMVNMPNGPTSMPNGSNGSNDIFNRPNAPSGTFSRPTAQASMFDEPNAQAGMINGPNAQAGMCNGPNAPHGMFNGTKSCDASADIFNRPMMNNHKGRNYYRSGEGVDVTNTAMQIMDKCTCKGGNYYNDFTSDKNKEVDINKKKKKSAGGFLGRYLGFGNKGSKKKKEWEKSRKDLDLFEFDLLRHNAKMGKRGRNGIVGQMGPPIHQNGSIGQIGNVPAMDRGSQYYQGMQPPSYNNHQQQQDMDMNPMMIIDQEEQQQQQPNINMYQTAMLPPQQFHPIADPFTHVFSDYNTEASCIIM